MAFGQASGPPASAAQLAELTELLARAGFDGFREARHPYGLTQRQSNGKFTRTEADELIERLTAEVGDDDGPTEPTAPSAVAGPSSGARAGARRPSGSSPSSAARRPPDVGPPADPPPADVTSAFPDELLADELRRRGWTCTPPG